MRRCPGLLQHTATHCNTLQHTATHCYTLQHTSAHFNTLQHTAARRNTLQHTATHCNTLHRTATHCNTLQRTAIMSRCPKLLDFFGTSLEKQISHRGHFHDQCLFVSFVLFFDLSFDMHVGLFEDHVVQGQCVRCLFCHVCSSHLSCLLMSLLTCM